MTIRTRAVDKPPGLAADPAAPSVLHVVLSLDCGGLEHVVLQLCQHAAREGRPVAVACIQQPGALAERARGAGAEVLCLGKRPGVDWRLRSRFARLLFRLRPQVVHTHQIGALFYAGPAAARAGVPVVHTEHGKHYGNAWKLRWLARYAASFCKTYVGVAPDVVDHAVQHGVVRRGKTRVVTNGVSLIGHPSNPMDSARRTLGLPDDAPVVGSVGRLEAVKNYALLINAFAGVRASLPGARLLLVGDGSQRTLLEAAAREQHVGDAVCFAGYQQQCGPFYQAMDVFCLTSDSEGLPLSLLEAMAAGTPVVASRVGGIPDVIRHGESGLLFDRGDRRAAVGLLRSVLEDPDFAARLAAAAAKEARGRYSAGAMAAAYSGLYAEAAAGRGA